MSSAAIRRLRKEYVSLQKEPACGALVKSPESNLLHAHFLLHGEVFYDTPYEGGIYHGVLKFPSNYPMKPPTVIARTPSGRFRPDDKICFSMSDFHPELWNPMWSVRSILTGLISFMNGEDLTTGGMTASGAQRARLARGSLEHCLGRDVLAVELFSDFLEGERDRRRRDGDVWPPKRLPPKPPPRPKISPRPLPALPSAPPPAPLSTAPTSGKNAAKNAAKNKKKREREKRKKLLAKLSASLARDLPPLLLSVRAALARENLLVDVPERVGWRAAPGERSALVAALEASPDHELPVEGAFRAIAGAEVLEISAGEEGMAGVERVEFVIETGDMPASPRDEEGHRREFDLFTKRHSNFRWVRGADERGNPEVSTELELDDFGVCLVKFRFFSLADVIQYEKSQL